MRATNCPTPKNRRFRTAEEAAKNAEQAAARSGVALTHYICEPGCGWWHLSRKAPTPYPHGLKPSPERLQELVQMDDATFQLVVEDEIRGKGTPEDRVALRHPLVLARWYMTLGRVVNEVDEQLGGILEPDQIWRRRVIAFKRAVEARRSEYVALAIGAPDDGGEPTAPADPGRAARTLRRQAHLAAVTRLKASHDAEFAGYLTEEYQRRSLRLPGHAARDAAPEGDEE